MNKNLTDQFMKWNSSTNIACCLLTRLEGDTFSISAANTRFTELLKITRGFKFKVQHPVLGYWRLLKKLHRVS